MSELEVAIANKLRWLDEYKNSIIFGHFPYNAHRWDCDQVARNNLVGVEVFILSGGILPLNFVWKDFDKNMVPIAASDIAAMIQTLFVFTGGCYQAYWTHNANINTLTTVTDVDNYDYTIGWPQTEP